MKELFRFHVICPECKKRSDTVKEGREPEPNVKCGDCLFERVEIVTMEVMAVTPVTV